MANIIEYLSNMSDYLSALQIVLKYHLDLDLDPALAQGTIILLAVFILLRIVGIPLNYLNLKGYFPIKGCIALEWLSIVTASLLGLLFYFRLYAWGFLDNPISLAISFFACIYVARITGFNAKISLLSLLVSSLTTVGHWSLSVPITNSSTIVVLSTWFVIWSLIFFFLPEVEQKTERSFSGFSKYISWLLADFLPQRESWQKKETRGDLVEILLVGITSLYFILPYVHTVFFYTGCALFCVYTSMLVVLLSEGNNIKFFVYAPVHIVLAAYKRCRYEQFNHDPLEVLSYKNAFFLLLGIVGFAGFCYVEGFVQPPVQGVKGSDLIPSPNESKPPHWDIEKRALPESAVDKAVPKFYKGGLGFTQNMSRGSAHIWQWAAWLVTLGQLGRETVTVIDTFGDAFPVRRSGESVTQEFANNTTACLREAHRRANWPIPKEVEFYYKTQQTETHKMLFPDQK